MQKEYNDKKKKINNNLHGSGFSAGSPVRRGIQLKPRHVFLT